MRCLFLQSYFFTLFRVGVCLKPSNSEISLQPRALYLDPPHSRLKSTQSEQVLTKIGRLEKVKLDAMSQSVLSMPAEFARGFKIKPNRERIRQILGTSSVLELQRQLLTTVMENEVRMPQLSCIFIFTIWSFKTQGCGICRARRNNDLTIGFIFLLFHSQIMFSY